jgi:hypothetical protein
MSSAAEALVIRARSGDQNAIAMISRIREKAPESKRAAIAYKMLSHYIRSNPVKQQFRFGREKASSERTKESLLRAIKQSTRKGTPMKDYLRSVRYIEKSPRRIDWLAIVAHIVADGQEVDETIVCAILPNLRGRLVLADKKPIPIKQAIKSDSVQIAKEWDAEFGAEGLLLERDGDPLAVEVGNYVVPVDDLFSWSFQASPDDDEIIKTAADIDPEERQPVRVGYVFGLARHIQEVRNGAPIETFSKVVAEELDET